MERLRSRFARMMSKARDPAFLKKGKSKRGKNMANDMDDESSGPGVAPNNLCYPNSYSCRYSDGNRRYSNAEYVSDWPGPLDGNRRSSNAEYGSDRPGLLDGNRRSSNAEYGADRLDGNRQHSNAEFGSGRPERKLTGLLSQSKRIFKKEKKRGDSRAPNRKYNAAVLFFIYTYRKVNIYFIHYLSLFMYICIIYRRVIVSPSEELEFYIELANMGLSDFNSKLKRRQDKFELVELLCVKFTLAPFVYHCNFTARPKSSTVAAEEVLFFAELPTVHCDGTVGLHCSVCCIIGPIGTVTGRQGCHFCSLQHPPDKEFIKKPPSPDYVLARRVNTP